MQLTDVVRDLAPYMQTWLEYQRDMSRVPGVQVAVRVGDELVASFALGQANEQTGEALTTHHLFRIASHSKSFTATCVMQLVEAGKLRLDDVAGQWLPELAGSAAASYTVRALLGHQTGINRDGADSDYWQQFFDFPQRESLLELCRAEAIYEPNQYFKYSNMGYSLLGLVIEAVSGQSYTEYVASHITGPLGLYHLGSELPADRLKESAAGHSARLGGHDVRRILPQSDTHAMAAATGFYGTAEDLTAFWVHLRDGDETLLSDASKRLMRRKESEVTRPVTRWYGLGLMLQEIGGRACVGHSGGFPGFITHSWLDPESGLAVSVLTNALGSPATEWATNLMNLIELARKPARQGADSAETPGEIDLNSFTGRYATSWGIYDVVNLGGRLVQLFPMGDPGMMSTELKVKDAFTLLPVPEAGYGAVGEAFYFERDDQGRVISVRQGGGLAWPIDEYRRRLAQPCNDQIESI